MRTTTMTTCLPTTTTTTATALRCWPYRSAICLFFSFFGLLPGNNRLAQSPLLVAAAAAEASTSSVSVASRFKSPNDATPSDVAQAWRDKDEALWSYVESHVPAVLAHTGSAAFDEHLKGVQAVLRYWGAPEHLTFAGLFHSIYGTEGFQGFSLPLSERKVIQKLIGGKAEKLCFVFCMVDRLTFDKTVMEWDPAENNDDATFTLRARPELGRFEMELSKEEWLDFLELTLADWLEQVEGAASKPSEIYHWKTGEAYAYRRVAYRKMSQILAVERAERLGRVAPDMFQAVMSTEALETRHLVQPRTPPTSKSAEEALAALRAAGEAIPEDLSPQSMEIGEACDAI